MSAPTVLDFVPRIRRKADLVVLDDVFEDPYRVRDLALRQPFYANPASHKGQRTRERFLFPGLKELFQDSLGVKITTWDEGFNGTFQFCTAADPIVYHSDFQQWAGALYLKPDAPFEAGTSLWSSIAGGGRTVAESVAFYKKRAWPCDPNEIERKMYQNKLLDRREWELVDQVGNRFNRLVLWNAKLVHSANSYFGVNKDDARLVQLFFFDGA